MNWKKSRNSKIPNVSKMHYYDKSSKKTWFHKYFHKHCGFLVSLQYVLFYSHPGPKLSGDKWWSTLFSKSTTKAAATALVMCKGYCCCCWLSCLAKQGLQIFQLYCSIIKMQGTTSAPQSWTILRYCSIHYNGWTLFCCRHCCLLYIYLKVLY